MEKVFRRIKMSDIGVIKARKYLPKIEIRNLLLCR